jgi:hypothetical protein
MRFRVIARDTKAAVDWTAKCRPYSILLVDEHDNAYLVSHDVFFLPDSQKDVWRGTQVEMTLLPR